MSQNNLNHFSDLSKYKIFDPTNTQWPSTVTDVQSALALIGSWARTDEGLPLATESVAGISKVATTEQINEGTDDSTFVTPKKLAVRLSNPQATETVLGLTKYATNAEAAALSINNKAIVPSALGYVFNNITSTTTRYGTIKLTTPAQAQAGTDETTATTPKRVVEMIAKFAPVAPTYSQTSETVLGLTQLATAGQTAQGTLRTGFAVSPFGFVNTRASQTQVGTTRLANVNEGRSYSDASLAISPAVLGQMKGSLSAYGIVRLAGGYDADQTAALWSGAPVVYNSLQINGHALTGSFNLGANEVGAWTTAQSDARYLFKGEGGNWCRGYAAVSGNAGGEWLTMGTNLPVNGTGFLTLTVKFDRNDDRTTNRVYNFDIRVNGQTVISDTINIWNSKGGSNGHSWRFEAYGTRHYAFNVPAGATVQVVPTGSYLALISNCVMMVNN